MEETGRFRKEFKDARSEKQSKRFIVKGRFTYLGWGAISRAGHSSRACDQASVSVHNEVEYYDPRRRDFPRGWKLLGKTVSPLGGLVCRFQFISTSLAVR